MRVAVTHIVAADTHREQFEAVVALRDALPGRPQSVLALGGGELALSAADIRRAPCWLSAPATAGIALDHALGRGAPRVLHVWSLAAVPASIACLRRNWRNRAEAPRMVLDGSLSASAATWRRIRAAAFDLPDLTVLTRGEAQRKWLIGLGWPAVLVALLPTWPGGRASSCSAERIRERLDLAPEQRIVSLALPTTRESGAFAAAWATLLAHEVMPSIRLLAPAGPERRRIARLVEMSARSHVARFPEAGVPSMDILTAADVCVFLGDGAAAPDALARLSAAGRPTVALDCSANRAGLGDVDVALCDGTKKSAARALLALLERPTAMIRFASTDAAARRADFLRGYGALVASLAGDPHAEDGCVLGPGPP